MTKTTASKSSKNKSTMPVKITPQDDDAKSANLVADNIQQLKTLFPEACAEGKIDFDVLRQLLGDAVDEREEKFGLSWHGKRRARQLALQQSMGTLRPCKADSVDWDTTKNLMIEGDNLEVLKLLQRSYAGKVKLIYIDPPYNTGNDFVYPDDFRDNIKNYLELTGQVASGKKLSTNTETSGRFHTDWLNMMYPRLKLAREFLKKDGVIIVSIDDGEVCNARLILDEIFGAEQFQAQIAVQSNKRGQTYKEIARTHEFLVVYSNSDDFQLNELEKSADALPFQDSTGPFDLWELRNRNPKFGRFNRPNLFFPIYVLPDSLDESGYSRVTIKPSANCVRVLPHNSEGVEGCWRWGTEKVTGSDLTSASPVLVARQKKDGKWNIYEKSRKSTTKIKSIWTDTSLINEQGTIAIGQLDMADVFEHPKPVALLQLCVFLATDPNDVVLDFFAGSGTMGQAVFAQNVSDGGTRPVVLVQLPEALDASEPRRKAAVALCTSLKKPLSIAELTKERLRRAAKKIKEESPMFAGDLGFRVFKLDSSNINTWDPASDDLEKTLYSAIQNLKDDRTEEDLLFEVLLKLGLELTVPIETKKVGKLKIHSIGQGTLIACLAPKLAATVIEDVGQAIVAWHQTLAPNVDSTVILRDSAFPDDVTKANLTAILQQYEPRSGRKLVVRSL